MTKESHPMGESKIITEETEKSSSKSPLPPFVKGGEHSRDTVFSTLYEERGDSTSVFRFMGIPCFSKNWFILIPEGIRIVDLLSELAISLRT